MRWRRARRPVPRGTSWHGTCARVPRERSCSRGGGAGPALVLPRILEVASTSTYASLVHSSVRSNRKEGAAQRPVGKLTRSQGDLTACACEALANAVTSPGPWASRCLPRGGGPRGRSGGCSGAWGLQCRRLAGVAATAETKHFVLGTWRSRTERGSRTEGRGCRAHIPCRPLPVTLPSTAPAGPLSAPGPPPRGPSHLWGLQARRVAGPSREASAATRPRAQLTGREGAGPVSARGPGTVLTSAQGSNPLLRELGQVQGYGKVKETACFMVSHQPHALAEGTCLTADPGGSASQGPHRAGSERPLCPALCGPVSLAGAASLALVSESRPV